jgi:hypothetical protein
MKTLQPNQTAALHNLTRKTIELEQTAAHHKALTAERNQKVIEALNAELTVRHVAQHAGVSYQYVDRLRNNNHTNGRHEPPNAHPSTPGDNTHNRPHKTRGRRKRRLGRING